MKTKLLLVLLVCSIAANAQYTKLFDFDGSTTGEAPICTFISDGTFLYGTTQYGGLYNNGTLFKIKADGSSYAKLLDFDSISNGGIPLGALVSDGTFLYGITFWGGSEGYGTIYKIKPDGTSYLKLLDFDPVISGQLPWGALYLDGTYLYGTNRWGGTNNSGVLYKIKTDGTGFSKLFDFNSIISGERPNGCLISDGTFLYGTTSSGGVYNDGVMYKIKSDRTSYSKLLDFADSTGCSIYGSLISDGTFLYGMTGYCGANDSGSVFKMKLDGTGYQRLLNFDGANGKFPEGGLLLDNGFLYGTTTLGGTNWNGVIFKLKTDGTGYTKLYDFLDTTSGSWSHCSLISDGTFLYGTARNGGINGKGTIFKYQYTTSSGITENNLEIKFDVAPNPTNGKFNINFNNQITTAYEIGICNVIGEQISFQTRATGIYLSNQPNGIYYITIKTNAGVGNKKIVLDK
jgi:uncharacterized repeat protein (TIGR03803 family)